MNAWLLAGLIVLSANVSAKAQSVVVSPIQNDRLEDVELNNDGGAQVSSEAAALRRLHCTLRKNGNSVSDFILPPDYQADGSITLEGMLVKIHAVYYLTGVINLRMRDLRVTTHAVGHVPDAVSKIDIQARYSPQSSAGGKTLQLRCR